MQKLGQHFLKDKKVLERIASRVEPKTISTIIEIGPGHGELTEMLVAHYPQSKIIALERDTRLVESFEKKFYETSASVRLGNALHILPDLVEKEIVGEYAVVGNIPYYITGFLFRILGELSKKPTSIVLLIQKEVAERVVAEKPDMNRLAASVQFWGKPEITLIVPPQAFRPAPKVHSAVITIIPKQEKNTISEEEYYETVRLLFAQPRKTILNNLSAAISKENSLKILEKLSIPPENRPQDLDISEIIEIAKTLSLS